MRRSLLLTLLLTLLLGLLLAQEARNSGGSNAGISAMSVPTVASLPPAAEQAMATVNPENIRAHVRFLSHDLLEGRGTGQRGGDIAAEYIATEFALY